MKINFLIVLAFILLLTSCSNDLSELKPSDWKYSSPQYFGLNPYTLLALDEELKEGDHGAIHSLTILKDQHIVFENYYQGHLPDELYSLEKGTQAVFYILAEELMQKANLQYEDKLVDIFDNYPSAFDNIPQKDKITLSHLINNKSGLWWNEWDFFNYANPNDADQMKAEMDWVDYILSRRMIREPGIEFNYNTGHTLLHSSAIENKLVNPLIDEIENDLFSPLGINNWQWDTAPNGRLNTITGLRLASGDMVKLGSLLLEDGQWNEKEIISKSWAKNLLNPPVINSAYKYKMGWFKFGVNHPYFVGESRMAQRFVYLWGEGGQFIFILPEQDMVVVFTGGFEPGNEQYYIFDILQKRIIPSILESSPGT